MICERAPIAALLALGGCYMQTQGIDVTVDAIVSPERIAMNGDAIAVTDDQDQVRTIDHGWIAITHVSLRRCDDDSDDDSVDGDALHFGVVPLDGRSDSVTLGVLHPAPASWCGVHVEYGPVGSLEDTGIPDGTWSLDLDDDDASQLHDADRHGADAVLGPTALTSRSATTLSIALPLARWLDGMRQTDDSDTMVHAIDDHLASIPPEVRIR